MANKKSRFPSYGLVRGPSHEHGGVAGVVADEQPVELEGGEWIIPKADECASQIVNHDYPFKAEFNKPNLDEQVDRREERKQLLEQRTYILER